VQAYGRESGPCQDVFNCIYAKRKLTLHELDITNIMLTKVAAKYTLDVIVLHKSKGDLFPNIFEKQFILLTKENY
jgi:hypothetical protein